MKFTLLTLFTVSAFLANACSKAMAQDDETVILFKRGSVEKRNGAEMESSSYTRQGKRGCLSTLPGCTVTRDFADGSCMNSVVCVNTPPSRERPIRIPKISLLAGCNILPFEHTQAVSMNALYQYTDDTANDGRENVDPITASMAFQDFVTNRAQALDNHFSRIEISISYPCTEADNPPPV